MARLRPCRGQTMALAMPVGIAAKSNTKKEFNLCDGFIIQSIFCKIARNNFSEVSN